MPTGSLPSAGKKIWEKVHKDALASGDSEETAAKKAWGAVRNAGWSKDKEGKWVHKSSTELMQEVAKEFALTIRKASYDPATGERRWRADASDVDADLYDDNMSLELFSDFIERADRNELPPEPIRDHYTSTFWNGGTPYLSLSHYPDLDGSAVPGVVDAIFIDGKFFKAKGRTFDNPLGNAVWNALKSDLEKRAQTDHTPVRISIAFLDYKHQHKDTGFIFERSFDSFDHMICPECVQNSKDGKRGGKIFLRGLLIHLALTRVPVNQRTLMEVDKSMTTRLEDAASIVGEELAKTIDEQAVAVGKSEAEGLVIRNEDETVVEETPTEAVPAVAPMDEVLLQEALTELRALVAELRAYKADKKEDEPSADEKEDTPEDEKEDEDEMKKKADLDPASFAVAFSTAIAPVVEGLSALNQRMDILIAANTQKSTQAGYAPERRSVAANSVTQLAPGQNDLPKPGQPMTIEQIIKRQLAGL